MTNLKIAEFRRINRQLGLKISARGNTFEEPLNRARIGLLQALVCAITMAGVAGCRQDMQNQPKMLPLRHSAFFDDGRSARQQVAGTVARSQSNIEGYLLTGFVNGSEGDVLPFPVTYAVLRRGQERFNIYCSPCHSRVGNGKGAVVARGFRAAGDMQSERLRTAPLGHFFHVITRGYGAMPSYSTQVAPVDRWAIAAYIRALQLSQNAEQVDVPSGVKVENLSAILRRSGYPEGFLVAWDPSFAVDEQANRPAAAEANHQTAIAPSAVRSATSLESGAKTKTSLPSIAATNHVNSASAETAKKGDPARGKDIYTANCSMCHQASRAGIPPVFPSLIGIIGRVGEEKVRTVARAGIPDAKPPMPPHPDLTDADINDLIAFLKTN
jgi:mono/diheme cytochrome c family protein